MPGPLLPPGRGAGRSPAAWQPRRAPSAPPPAVGPARRDPAAAPPTAQLGSGDTAGTQPVAQPRTTPTRRVGAEGVQGSPRPSHSGPGGSRAVRLSSQKRRGATARVAVCACAVARAPPGRASPGVSMATALAASRVSSAPGPAGPGASGRGVAAHPAAGLHSSPSPVQANSLYPSLLSVVRGDRRGVGRGRWRQLLWRRLQSYPQLTGLLGDTRSQRGRRKGRFNPPWVHSTMVPGFQKFPETACFHTPSPPKIWG